MITWKILVPAKRNPGSAINGSRFTWMKPFTCIVGYNLWSIFSTAALQWTKFHPGKPNFIVWLLFLLEMLGNMCILIICYLACDVINFETNLRFLINPIFLHNQKVRTKILISEEQKELLTRNSKHFSPFLKGFQLPENVSNPRLTFKLP